MIWTVLHKCWFLWECLKRISSKVKQTVYIHVPFYTSCWFLSCADLLLCWLRRKRKGATLTDSRTAICRSQKRLFGNPCWSTTLSRSLYLNWITHWTEGISCMGVTLYMGSAVAHWLIDPRTDSYTSCTDFPIGYDLINSNDSHTNGAASESMLGLGIMLQNTWPIDQTLINGKSLDNSHRPNIKKWENRWGFSSHHKYIICLI